jgi:hypothetical protein
LLDSHSAERGTSWKHIYCACKKQAVKEILYRYAVFKPCTSRVEQDISVIEEVLGGPAPQFVSDN